MIPELNHTISFYPVASTGSVSPCRPCSCLSILKLHIWFWPQRWRRKQSSWLAGHQAPHPVMSTTATWLQNHLSTCIPAAPTLHGLPAVHCTSATRQRRSTRAHSPRKDSPSPGDGSRHPFWHLLPPSCAGAEAAHPAATALTRLRAVRLGTAALRPSQSGTPATPLPSNAAASRSDRYWRRVPRAVHAASRCAPCR